MTRYLLYCTLIALTVTLAACSGKQPQLAIDRESAVPGTAVSRQGNTLALLGQGIELGQQIPDTNLVDAYTMQAVDLKALQGNVLFLSIVPSIDTKVCETQTHLLGENGDTLPSAIRRITISRDTPFAQKRFAEEAKLTDIQYLSDYKEGAFGRSTGLLIDASRLLARSVILVDKEGVVRYIQVVPDISHLPDMDKAFAKARELDKMP